VSLDLNFVADVFSEDYKDVDENMALLAIKVNQMMLTAIEEDDRATLEFLHTILSKSSIECLTLVLNDDQLQKHFNKPILQHAIRHYIQRVNERYEKSVDDNWIMHGAYMNKAPEVTAFMQSNNSTLLYKDFVNRENIIKIKVKFRCPFKMQRK
jgi:hypothetical protein